MREEMIVTDPFEIGVAGGVYLRGDVRYLPGPLPQSVIIICHSFMAFKDWGFFPHMAERFALKGYATVSFNFSGNGVPPQGIRIADFARFEKNTISAEIRDLATLLDAIREGRIGSPHIDGERIILLGHSRGGAVAIIHAAERSGPIALVTLASVATLQRWTRHQLQEWRWKGFLPLSRDTSVSPLRLGVEFLDDLEANGERFNVIAQARSIRIPWLIIHGTADVTVPPAEAEMLYGASNRSTTTLLLLEHTGHLFHARAPEEDGYKTLDEIIDRTDHWLHSTLFKESSWNGNRTQQG